MAAAAAVGAVPGERSVPPQQSIFFHELNELMQNPIFLPFGATDDIEQILLGLKPPDNFFPVAGNEDNDNLGGDEASSSLFLIFDVTLLCIPRRRQQPARMTMKMMTMSSLLLDHRFTFLPPSFPFSFCRVLKTDSCYVQQLQPAVTMTTKWTSGYPNKHEQNMSVMPAAAPRSSLVS